MIKKHLLYILPLLVLSACKDDDAETVPVKGEVITLESIPAFYTEGTRAEPDFTVIAERSDRVQEPQDIDFHPTRANELWVLNKGTNSGGSTVTISNVGLTEQSELWRKDGNSYHFMAFPSAISFSKTNENFGTTANIQDANRQGGTFTGPSLWSSDMSIYAQDPGNDADGVPLNGSHLDMLHGSPYCMGMESDEDNAFWVFDSYNGHIAWYDFAADHGPGYHDHSNGVIYRYVEMPLTRDPSGIPSHIVEDDVSGILFVCDPANSRVLWMNTQSGVIDKSLPLINEQLASHQEMKGLEWGIFTDIGLDKPCGIEIIGDILYVSDNATGEIIAYHKETKVELARVTASTKGIMGLKADKNGVLFFVNAETHDVVRIDPK
ncbi:MAG: hypothetical protein ACI9GO_000803 [Bacteroidia bacterium]|jgi:hypothetical protein